MKTKHFLLLFLFILSIVSSNYLKAQSVEGGYLNPDVQWQDLINASYFNFACQDFASEYSFITYYIDGDTVINDQAYYKMYSTRRDSVNCGGMFFSESTNTTYRLAIREDVSKKFYSIFNGSTTEGLLWDFNLSFGSEPKPNCIIGDVDEVTIAGEVRSRFRCDCEFYDDYVIEGVGGTRGFLGDFYCATGFESNTSLLCYNYNGEVFQLEENNACGLQSITGIGDRQAITQIDVYPNPSNTFVQLQLPINFLNDNSVKVQIYNALGQIHTTEMIGDNRPQINTAHWQAGIYFGQIQNPEGGYYSFKLVKE